WGYPDFRSCIHKEFRISRRTAQELINVHRTYVERLRLPPERVRALEWSKAALLASVATPENIDAILRDLDQGLYFRHLKSKYKLAGVPAPRAAPPPAAGDQEVLPAADWRRPKPPEDQFYLPDPEWEGLCYGMHSRENVLLLGHSGCGKTEVCSLLAQAFD